MERQGQTETEARRGEMRGKKRWTKAVSRDEAGTFGRTEQRCGGRVGECWADPGGVALCKRLASEHVQQRGWPAMHVVLERMHGQRCGVSRAGRA